MKQLAYLPILALFLEEVDDIVNGILPLLFLHDMHVASLFEVLVEVTLEDTILNAGPELLGPVPEYKHQAVDEADCDHD